MFEQAVDGLGCYESEQSEHMGNSSVPELAFYAIRSDKVLKREQSNCLQNLSLLLQLCEGNEELEEKALQIACKFVKRYGFDWRFEPEVRKLEERLRKSEIKNQNEIASLRLLSEALAKAASK